LQKYGPYDEDLLDWLDMQGVNVASTTMILGIFMKYSKVTAF